MSNTNFDGNVFIDQLTTVIIPEGVSVKLKSFKSIEILPSAKPIIRGDVSYDNSNQSVPSDSRIFHGINVWGIPNKSSPGIEAVLNGGFPWGNPDNNGAIIMDGGQIIDSYAAIRSIDGGIVYVNNGLISNYWYSGIIFSRIYSPTQQLPLRPTLAIVKNSEFVNNQPQYSNTDNGTSAIVAEYMHGLKISNCDFYNSISNSDFPSKAIGLHQSGCLISNCKFYDFNLEGDNYAIISSKFLSSVKGYITIRNNEFHNCRMSGLLRGEEHTQINNNTFYCPSSKKSIGIELQGSNSFNINNNTFYDYGKSFINDGNLSKGIEIYNSGDMGNILRSNQFFDCSNGVMISEDNRGIQLKCNEFYANSINASINFTSRLTNLNIPVNKREISDQGAIISGDYIGRYLPGNLFTQTCQNANECDFYISADHPDVKYFYYNSTNPSNLTYPEYHTQSYLIPLMNTDAFIENRTSGCYNYLEDLPEIISRKNDAQILKTGLLPFEETDSIQQTLHYLEDYIEIENANLLWHLQNNEEIDTVYAFLKNDDSEQSKLWLASLYLDNGHYDSAELVLNQISISDEDSYHYLNQQFLLKIANHFALGNDVCNFSAQDLSYFETMATLYSPIASRSRVLLGIIDLVCVNNELLSSTRNLNPKRNLKANIIIGPKPSSDYINIQANYSGSTFKIVNLTGQIVKEGIINSKANLSVLDLNNGIFQLIIYNLDGSISSEKFVKMP